MTPEEKPQLDVRDFWRIHDGLEAYVNLDAKGTMERLKTHKEDAFCEVTGYGGKGKRMCTRDGTTQSTLWRRGTAIRCPSLTTIP